MDSSTGALPWLVFAPLSRLAAAALPGPPPPLPPRFPARPGTRVALEPVTFGDSQKVRRSPRHAVRLHRTLVTTVLVCALAILILPGVLVLRTLGISGLQVAIGLVLPTFVVALYSRRRDSLQ